VSADNDSSSIAEELSKIEKICQRAAADLASSRNVRETVELAEVDVPHHLRAIASDKLPVLRRLARARDLRVEEVVKEQLDWLSREPSETAARREFDRLKAIDWPTLRTNYPDLYWKFLREANLIIERKRKR
jgi:hypothetical protein